ncbi:putative fidgetin-like protein 2 [Scleropages formosus]|uniref:Putative fidgetin-like protein 2 n=1 Tax=Scleropages formosus TaxID=113540 RepID=A0A0P7TV70_SCLFO|nr:putative fidgetin-like protein 2 [Scleropages formosus]
MHWTPEHAQPLSQWPEQHLDVSSTTSSPAHKPELYPSRGRGYSYAWANDDISALTASNLLKRYAEKYSSPLDSPYDRPPVGVYPDPAAFGSLSGQKGELEPWSLAHSTEGAFPLVTHSTHEGIAGTKSVTSSATLPGGAGGPVEDGRLSDTGYSGGSSCSGPPSHDYPTTYNGTYVSSGYCPQPASVLPPGPLHALQPTPTLVPSYNSPSSVYNYSHHAGLAPGYTHPSTPYLASGLAAPTPLPQRPTVVGGSYGYQNHNLVGSEPGSSMKRKAFEMTTEDEEGDGLRYRKYGYEHARPEDGSPYGVGDKDKFRGNGLSTASTDPEAFKPGKPPSQPGLGGEEVGKYIGLKPMISSPYGGAEEYSPPTGLTGENGGGGHGFLPHQLSGAPLKAADTRLLKLVNEELQDHSPTPAWGELLGHTHVKAALEEDLLWPALRPGPASPPPRTVLLFGPPGGGKTTLARGLSIQLGATFFRLSCATLASKWKAEGEDLLRTLFLVATTHQPCVVLLSQVEALGDQILQQQLLSHLEGVQHGSSGPALVVGTTSRPDLLEEAVQRSFSKRYYVPLPDAGTRKQVLLQALAPQGCCLSEGELALLLQRTEGFSVHELLQLCQQASSSFSVPPPSSLHGLGVPLATPTFKDFEKAFCKVRPHATPKELDTCLEWSRMNNN